MLTQTYYSMTMQSPVGPLYLLASEKGLCGVYFSGEAHHVKALTLSAIEDVQHPVLVRAKQQLEEYFAGKRQAFDLKLDVQGTIFQKKAWKQLQAIGYAQTISYGEQATRMGDPKKARAVGIANGRNPLSIIVPCHRVVGASGSLTGYAGGLKNKEKLLALEARIAGVKAAA